MDTQMVSKLHRKVISPLIDGEASEHSTEYKSQMIKYTAAIADWQKLQKRRNTDSVGKEEKEG